MILLPNHVVFYSSCHLVSLNLSNIQTFLLFSLIFLGSWILGSLRNLDSAFSSLGSELVGPDGVPAGHGQEVLVLQVPQGVLIPDYLNISITPLQSL